MLIEQAGAFAFAAAPVSVCGAGSMNSRRNGRKKTFNNDSGSAEFSEEKQ